MSGWKPSKKARDKLLEKLYELEQQKLQLKEQLTSVESQIEMQVANIKAINDALMSVAKRKRAKNEANLTT